MDITIPQTLSASNPFLYNGILLDRNEAEFDSNIGVDAHDPAGVQSLTVQYSFTCAGANAASEMPSFNNGAYGRGSCSNDSAKTCNTLAPLPAGCGAGNACNPANNPFTVNSTPGPQNGGTAPTDLTFPVTVTTNDLKAVGCPNGATSGTLDINVTATNFSNNSNSQQTRGDFQILIGPGSAFVIPPGCGTCSRPPGLTEPSTTPQRAR
jgi:hypothetical protein